MRRPLKMALVVALLVGLFGFAPSNAPPVQAQAASIIYNLYATDGYVGELSYFLDCVKNKTRPTRVTAADAVVGLKIVEAEKRSVESGKPEPV